MSITYDEWVNSDKRDGNPLPIELAGVRGFPETILYDRFFRTFVLLKGRKVIPVEQFLDALG